MLSVSASSYKPITQPVSGPAPFKARNLLDISDIEAIVQQQVMILSGQAYGYSVLDSFTHGTSRQRMRWFKRATSTDLQHSITFVSDSELKNKQRLGQKSQPLELFLVIEQDAVIGGLYYADFIAFTILNCAGGTAIRYNELPISVPLF